MRSKLAVIISKCEGFDVLGSVPNKRNNPGDLRHSPHASHEPGKPNDIGHIDTPEHGWEDLERQLVLFANRGLTLREMVAAYAPPSENNTCAYLDTVCKGLGLGPDTFVKEALKIKFA